MSLYDDYLERDSKGMVRVPLLDMTEAQAKKLIEFIYMHTLSHQSFGYREREEQTFGEYGKMSRIGKKRERPNKHWSWEDVKCVLENHLANNDDIGRMLGRTGFAIRMQRGNIMQDFDTWVNENPNVCKGLNRNQQIDIYRKEGYTELKGDLE